MDRRAKQKNTEPAPSRADRESAARFAREEAADVLAEALWLLLCAGRWPKGGVEAHRAPGAALSEHLSNELQPAETMGV